MANNNSSSGSGSSSSNNNNSNKGKCQVCPKFSESRCSWCKLVFYCSKEHQKQDWPHHKETCTKKKYRMEENEQLGRHLVATEDIKPDQILFKDKPLVLSYKVDTLEYTGNKICVGCYKEIPLVVKKKPEQQQHKSILRRQQQRRNKEGDEEEEMRKALEKIEGLGRTTGKQDGRRCVQSENNECDDYGDEDEEEKKRKDNDENSSGFSIVSKTKDNGVGDDDADDVNDCGDDEEEDSDDDSDAAESDDDNSDDEDNDDEETVCLSCRLPLCTPECSAHYFHKQLECRLLREAAAFHNNPQPPPTLQQSPGTGATEFSLSSEKPAATTSSSCVFVDEHGKTQAGKKVSFAPAAAASATLPLSSAVVMSPSNENNKRNSSSNHEDSMSLGSTWKDTTGCCVPTPSFPPPGNRNNIWSISDGIRETLLRNLLYFRCLLLKHANEGHWNELMSLQSNEEARKNDVASLEKSSRIFALIKKTLAEINHPTMNQVCKPDIHKLVGIIEINALNVNISQNVEVTGIFPKFSLLEHSCIPSVKYYLCPCPPPCLSASTSKQNEQQKKSHLFELYCRSAVKLKSGDHLSVSYTNAILWNTEKRREFLKKEKHFWCECRRCNSADELGSNFSTILCPLQDCKAPSVPVPIGKAAAAAGGKGGGGKSNNNINSSGGGGGSNLHEFQWKCTSAKCKKTCAGWQVKKVDTKLCEMVGKTKASIESYKECLAKMEELVHPDYYLCCIVIHSLIQMYGHDTSTVHEKKLLEEKIALCNKLLSVIKKLDPGLAVLNVYASVVFYEMHSAILAMAGAEMDDDYHILRNNPETVNLAKVYLQRCIDCFKYEFFELPENKLKMLAMKKMEYLNLVMNRK